MQPAVQRLLAAELRWFAVASWLGRRGHNSCHLRSVLPLSNLPGISVMLPRVGFILSLSNVGHPEIGVAVQAQLYTPEALVQCSDKLVAAAQRRASYTLFMCDIAYTAVETASWFAMRTATYLEAETRAAVDADAMLASKAHLKQIFTLI